MAESTPPILDYDAPPPPPPPGGRLEVLRDGDALIISVRRAPLWRDLVVAAVGVVLFGGCLTGVALTGGRVGRACLIGPIFGSVIMGMLLLASRSRTRILLTEAGLVVSRGRETLFSCGGGELTEFAVLRTVGAITVGQPRPYLQARRGVDAFVFRFLEDVGEAELEWIAATVRRTLGVL